jgi:hypothetical protein
MVRHKFKLVPGSTGEAEGRQLLECEGCGERIVLPPPPGHTKAQYLRKLNIRPDCDLQKVAQVMEW